jgi:oligopeptidase A
VLSADAFAAFEEAGLDNETAVQATGRRYRDTILSLGGGTHPMEVFQSFRGRPPTVDALLRHTGLKKYIN